MSGLAALLAGHDEPGLYRWHGAARAADVEHTVTHAGWDFAHLDGWGIEDTAAFLAAAVTALGGGEESARSFDALSDCLGDVDSHDHEGVVLLWDGWSPFARRDPQAFSVALSVLGGRAHADRGCRFAALLRGDGPPLDVPELPEHAARP